MECHPCHTTYFPKCTWHFACKVKEVNLHLWSKHLQHDMLNPNVMVFIFGTMLIGITIFQNMDEQPMKCMPGWKKKRMSNEKTLCWSIENWRGKMNQGTIQFYEHTCGRYDDLNLHGGYVWLASSFVMLPCTIQSNFKLQHCFPINARNISIINKAKC